MSLLRKKLKTLDMMENRLRGQIARGEVTQREAERTAGFIHGSREALNSIASGRPGYRNREEIQSTLLGLKAAMIVADSTLAPDDKDAVQAWRQKMADAFEAE